MYSLKSLSISLVDWELWVADHHLSVERSNTNNIFSRKTWEFGFKNKYSNVTYKMNKRVVINMYTITC